MKYLIALTVFLLTPAFAVDRFTTIDPNIQSTVTVSCTMPVTRENGDPLALNEIAQINFHVSDDDSATYTQAGTNTQCSQVYTLMGVTDGVYYYAASAVDTNGRESQISVDRAVLTVKRLAAPAAPTGLGFAD